MDEISVDRPNKGSSVGSGGSEAEENQSLQPLSDLLCAQPAFWSDDVGEVSSCSREAFVEELLERFYLAISFVH